MTRFRAAAVAEELDEVQDDWESAVEDLLAEWEDVAADQVDELVAQVEDAVAAGDLLVLAALTVGTGAAVTALTAAMTALAVLAAKGMADAAGAQGVDVEPGEVDQVWVDDTAEVVAELLGDGLATSAGQEAVRLATPGTDAAVVADGVSAHLTSLTDTHLRVHMGGALSAAQNRGRFATLAIAPVATYEATEVNDPNRCGPCGVEDGYTFATLDEALAVYGNGGFPGCEGRWRCRGTVVATWDVEDAA